MESYNDDVSTPWSDYSTPETTPTRLPSRVMQECWKFHVYQQLEESA
jgi:hypothetical protein